MQAISYYQMASEAFGPGALKQDSDPAAAAGGCACTLNRCRGRRVTALGRVAEAWHGFSAVVSSCISTGLGRG